MCYHCRKPGHIVHFCYKANNNDQENANNTKNDDYAFSTQHKAYSNTMYKWIMDSGASNHRTSCRAAFDTYEVIASCNVYLEGNSVVKVVKLGSIIVDVMVRGKIRRVRIKDALHMPKLQANLLPLSKFLSNGLKVQFNLKECVMKGPDGEVIAMGLHNGNLYNLYKIHGVDATHLAQS